MALELLGISVDGVSISANIQLKDVHIDTYGSEIPFDKVGAGVIWNISAELIYYDLAVLAKLQSEFSGTTVGQLGSIGTLMVAGGHTHRLLIASPKLTQPYNFPMALLVDSDDFKLNAVDPIIHTLKWQAMASQQTVDSLNALIWNTTTT